MGIFKRHALLSQARRGLERLRNLKVEDKMTDYVITITPEKNVMDAAAMMIGENISAVVVEEEDKPAGILTERDFITKVPLSQEVYGLKVQDIMSCSFSGGKPGKCAIETVKPDASLQEARDILKEKRIRKLVILDEEERIKGIITQTDLSKSLYDSIKVAAVIKAPFLIKEVMTKKIVSIEEDSGFSEAKRSMTKHGISALPVKHKGEYVGIFTEYDVVMQFYDKGGRLDIRKVPDIMQTPVKAIPSELNIFDANTIMLFQKIRRLLVVEEKKVVGILTQTDLIHACFAYLEQLERYLQENSAILKEQDLVPLKQKGNIISEYATEHIRAYTMH